MIMAAALLLSVVGLSSPPLLVQRHPSGWLELTLNRPDKLNALSSELIDSLQEQVIAAGCADIKGVLLTAAPGRAFCAGGDIREAASVPLADAQNFLRREYRLMLTLKELNAAKPVVALAEGFVFGAGAGLFMSADTRIVSASSTFAMPECVLGIVPDTGASDFLRAMPGSLGRWASLTGARLAAPMMAATGLATHAMEADEGGGYGTSRAELRERLLACGSTEQLEASLSREGAAARAVAKAVGVERLESLSAAAERCFGPGLEQADENLASEYAAALLDEDEALAAWANDARAKLSRAEPAALLLADECLRVSLGENAVARRAKALGVELAANCKLAGRPAFQEGVSCAVGAKKGEVPRWEHSSVQAAAADPAVAAILEAVREAEPLPSSF